MNDSILKRKFVSGCIAAAVIIAAAGCGSTSEGSASEGTTTAAEESEKTGSDTAESSSADTSAADSGYKDGTYTGTGVGYGGKVEMEVTIENGKITDIQVGSNKEDKIYMDEAIAVIDEVLNNQSTDVDAVSGATASSDGILSGIAKALGEAKK